MWQPISFITEHFVIESYCFGLSLLHGTESSLVIYIPVQYCVNSKGAPWWPRG